MINQILTTIKNNNMLNQNDKVLIGLSGGADSVTLLYVLIHLADTYNLNILAVHINHGLRGEEAKRDEDFVVDLCYSLNIKLIVEHIDVKSIAREQSLTEEEAGRLARYKIFEDISNKENIDKIAIAHNKNDNAETILMRLTRGTGLKGLCGIPKVRDKIIRPLINTTRKEIEYYCLYSNINYITDSTNNDYKYTRNIIRHKIVNTLENDVNSSAIDNIVRASQIIEEENNYIEEQTLNILNEILSIENEIELDISKLLEQHIVIQRRVIRKACEITLKDFKNISKENTECILNLMTKNTGKRIVLENRLTVKKSYNKLVFSNDFKKEINETNFSYKIKLNVPIYIKEINKYIRITTEYSEVLYTYSFDCVKMISKLEIRNRQIGDNISINNNTKTIKKYFIDEKIPVEKRNHIPLLVYGSDVIWIMSCKNTISDKYKPKGDNKENLLYITILED